MFSGIVEGMGEIQNIQENGSNKIFWIKNPFQETLHVDQSMAHDGVCLTVEEVKDDVFRVTAVLETLSKTTLGNFKKGSLINLERSLTLGSFVDGHLVQGHVDNIGTCINKWEADGSWFFQFQFDPSYNNLLVEKGSITINGISLTAFDVAEDHFTVAIIPYTYQHTNLQKIESGSAVNLEFDLIGKYVQKQWASYQLSIG